VWPAPGCIVKRGTAVRAAAGTSGTPTSSLQGSRFHPRNRHQGHYDFPRLVGACAELAARLIRTPDGSTSIDFADPLSLRLLNKALLQTDYGITHWEIPPGYLCPPVPGRADYLHGLADILAGDHGGTVPRGPQIRCIDLGTGANGIYPLLGHAEYGWSFVATDCDRLAVSSARNTVAANPGLAGAIEIRLQTDRERLYQGVVAADDHFELSLCNPPFHRSAGEANQGSTRKNRNLGLSAGRPGQARRNFGGQANELWCTGGERGFITRMINESALLAERILWFSSLVSKSENLAGLRRELGKHQAAEVRTVPMAQGSKKSRFLAWTFLDAGARAAWLTRRAAPSETPGHPDRRV